MTNHVIHPKRLVEVSLVSLAATSPDALATRCEADYAHRLKTAATRIVESKARIVMLTGPSASGKTTSAHLLADTLTAMGVCAKVVSVDNFFLGSEHYPLLPNGQRDYESPATVDMPLINHVLNTLRTEGKAELPIYDFARESRSDKTQFLDLEGGICIVEGTHALNPALTSTLPRDSVFRIYASMQEEYATHGVRTISTRDMRLCRRMLRDVAQRGHSPEKTFAMWGRVLEAENQYVRVYKTSADLVLDTSFTYELLVIAGLLPMAECLLTDEGRRAPIWRETAASFANVENAMPVSIIPEGSMLREFYGMAGA